MSHSRMPVEEAKYRRKIEALRRDYKERGTSITVVINTKLREEWQRRKKAEGMRAAFSDLVNTALLFGLWGPHPYDDPVVGLKDALEYYTLSESGGREKFLHLIRSWLKLNGVSPEELLSAPPETYK